MTDLQIVTKAQLQERGQPRTEIIAIPELGEGAAIRVRGYSLADAAEIRRASISTNADGHSIHDPKQDLLLSLMLAVAEPALSINDATWLLDLDIGLVTRIINAATRLSGSEPSAFEAMKEGMRKNLYLRRMYVICAETFGRFPSELSDVTEEEFNRYLAAAEVEIEERRQVETPED